MSPGPHQNQRCGWRFETGLCPPVKYFYLPFQGGTSFVDHLCYLYLVYVMLSCACSLLPCGHLLGRFDLLALVCDVNCAFVTFLCGILGQVWYLIISITDLCSLSYFASTM